MSRRRTVAAVGSLARALFAARGADGGAFWVDGFWVASFWTPSFWVE